MTTNQLVSNYRTMYSLYSDDVRWTDRYIISLFNIARAKLLKDESKRERLKRTNWTGFCMPLCLAKPLECPCIAEAMCYALVSKYELPDYIALQYPYNGIEIRRADGSKLDEWHPRDASLSSLNPATKNKQGYWIENYRGKNKLVVWNTLDLELVYVNMLVTNLDDIDKIAKCGEEDGVTTTSCTDWTTEEFPLDSNLIYDLFRLTNSLMLAQMRDVDDSTNDTQDKLEN